MILVLYDFDPFSEAKTVISATLQKNKSLFSVMYIAEYTIYLVNVKSWVLV